jgi:hypothetical protein
MTFYRDNAIKAERKQWYAAVIPRRRHVVECGASQTAESGQQLQQSGAHRDVYGGRPPGAAILNEPKECAPL